MVTAALIMVANDRIPASHLNSIIAMHRTQRLQPYIIVAYIGQPPPDIAADAITSVPDHPISLARARNAAADMTDADWLIFVDADTYYLANLLEFIRPESETSRGHLRSDVMAIGGDPICPPYTVVAAPLFIRRTLFQEIGCYHDGYSNYGYEDIDLFYKLPSCQCVDTDARHVVPIHNMLASDGWQRGLNANEGLYEARIKLPVAERIRQDIEARRGPVR